MFFRNIDRTLFACLIKTFANLEPLNQLIDELYVCSTETSTDVFGTEIMKWSVG